MGVMITGIIIGFLFVLILIVLVRTLLFVPRKQEAIKAAPITLEEEKIVAIWAIASANSSLFQAERDMSFAARFTPRQTLLSAPRETPCSEAHCFSPAAMLKRAR